MKKRIVCLLMACVMLLMCGCDMISELTDALKEPDRPQESVAVQAPAAQPVPSTVEGPGFNSPEEAILAYARALQKGDVQEILSTFAIETYVDKYDLTAWIENSGAYTISAQQPIPSSDEYTMGLNRIARQYNITKNLTYMYMTLGKVENFVSPITFNGEPYDKPSELVDDMVIYNWMDMLAKMEIGNVLRFEDLFQDVEQVNRALENNKRYLNCQELIPLAVELTIDGEQYYLCVDVACYDGRWYNCNFFGTIGIYLGASALGGGLYPLED